MPGCSVTVKAYDKTGAPRPLPQQTPRCLYLTNLTTGAAHRVNSPPCLRLRAKQPRFDSGRNGTSLQFALGGATNLEMGISRPCDYCQMTPISLPAAWSSNYSGIITPTFGGLSSKFQCV